MTLRRRLELSFAVIATVAALIALSNWFQYRRLEGDARAINVSGSQRMRAYRIASLASQHAAHRDLWSAEEIEDELDRYARLLLALREGDAERGLDPTPEGDARDALETKIARLAAERRTDDDLAEIEAALRDMERDIESGGRGVHADERFHGAVTRAAHSPLLAQMMATIGELIRESRIESLAQPERPRNSLAGHRAVADAIAAGDADGAAAAMHAHIMMVSDVALLRD